ncbi:MAG: GPP34 family phosphoprotein [Candidatus Hermodarchaeota archaeon]
MLLCKELLLILPKENKGKLQWSKAGWIRRVIFSGAILNDLFLHDRIAIEEKPDRRIRSKGPIPEVNTEVVHIDKTPTDIPILDEILDILTDERKNIVSVIQQISLSKKKKLEAQLWNELEAEGTVQNKGKKHIIIDTEVRNELLQRIKDTVTNKKDPDDHMKALLGFIGFKATYDKKFYKKHFIKSKLDREWRKRILEDQVIYDSTSSMVAFIWGNKASGEIIYKRIKV